MLEIKNISKTFNSKLVLENISFAVPKGKIFGIIGPNGAGKTTTLRIILGILPPTSGDILFNGTKLDQHFLNLTGYLPEERGLYPKSTVNNTLVYLAQLKGLSYSKAISNVNYWLNRLELSEYGKYNVEELSKGNQQKVQFISSILHEPKILILDEPFSGFDPVNQSIFREIIEEMKNDRFIILSTHLMDLAETLCDEIFLIDEGREVISGKVNEVLNSKPSNIYQISFPKASKENIVQHLSDYNIISQSQNSITVDLVKNNAAKFLQNISSEFEVEEFKKRIPSLHELFISLVEKNS